MRSRKRILLTFIIFLITLSRVSAVTAQIKNPVRWSITATSLSAAEAEVSVYAFIEQPWHIYSQFMEEGGPLPTKFTFDPSSTYELIGKPKESKSVQSFDNTFGIKVAWFEKNAAFTQRIKLKGEKATVSLSVEFMACTHDECLPPKEVKLSVDVIPLQKEEYKEEKTSAVIPMGSTVNKTAVVTSNPTDSTTPAKQPVKATASAAEVRELEKLKEAEPGKSEIRDAQLEQGKAPQRGVNLWAIFIAGLAGGLAAIAMPCIFPMIPFTVGVFSKRKKGSDATFMSVIFGFSIIAIYVVVGLFITVVFGPAALNGLATNGIFNFAFFILLIVFAASFLGAFEITLPSSWVNRIEAKTEGPGMLSIFFMAASLALVSFSCTGPIIGTLLVEAATLGSFKGPAIGMLGFSIALALPFTLFSLFPAWLSALPKSGGWMNTIKGVLGFLELALALKFLSNVDLAYHWNLLDREVFLVLWIIIFGCLGFYLLGKLRLSNDSQVEHVSTVRLFAGIITLAFTLYMMPGLLGAPLKAVAAFLPPQHTQDFNINALASTASSLTHASIVNDAVLPVSDDNEDNNNNRTDVVEEALFHAPHNLTAFFDFKSGMNYARKVNKPVLIDFTGHACVNCRKMEAVVWSDPQILKRLQQDYVLIQLYVDDKTDLPPNEQYYSELSDMSVETIGNKWSDFQATKYNSNSQPYYVLLDQDEHLLVQPKGAEYDIELFKKFLDSGLTAFNKR